MSSHHYPASARELLSNSHRVARLSRGRDAFVWRGRVLPIGLPLGVALGAASSYRRRDRPAAAFVVTVAGVLALAYAGALLEWRLDSRRDRLAREA